MEEDTVPDNVHQMNSHLDLLLFLPDNYCEHYDRSGLWHIHLRVYLSFSSPIDQHSK